MDNVLNGINSGPAQRAGQNIRNQVRAIWVSYFTALVGATWNFVDWWKGWFLVPVPYYHDIVRRSEI